MDTTTKLDCAYSFCLSHSHTHTKCPAYSVHCPHLIEIYFYDSFARGAINPVCGVLSLRCTSIMISKLMSGWRARVRLLGHFCAAVMNFRVLCMIYASMHTDIVFKCAQFNNDYVAMYALRLCPHCGRICCCTDGSKHNVRKLSSPGRRAHTRFILFYIC